MLSATELDRVERIVADAQKCILGDWDLHFIQDMAERLEEHGDDLRVSDRQWQQLKRIEDQYNL